MHVARLNSDRQIQLLIPHQKTQVKFSKFEIINRFNIFSRLSDNLSLIKYEKKECSLQVVQKLRKNLQDFAFKILLITNESLR